METNYKVELKYKQNNGGRSKYFRATGKDCVTRAIAIVLNRDYKEVHDTIKKVTKRSPLYGVSPILTHHILIALGFEYVKFNGVRRFTADNIPMNEYIIADSLNHVCAVINGEVNDTFKSHEYISTRFINGYYKLKTKR